MSRGIVSDIDAGHLQQRLDEVQEQARYAHKLLDAAFMGKQVDSDLLLNHAARLRAAAVRFERHVTGLLVTPSDVAANRRLIAAASKLPNRRRK